jgi:hypothetical protein
MNHGPESRPRPAQPDGAVPDEKQAQGTPTLRRKQLLRTILCVSGALVLLVFVTADYHKNGAGIYRMSHAPFFIIDVGPTQTWMVPHGINYVPDHGVGQAGNVIEFPLCPGYRLGVRYFSGRWWREAHPQ